MTTNRSVLYDIMNTIDIFVIFNYYLFLGNFGEFLGAENTLISKLQAI
jgi:hypothetical protein